MKWPAVLLALVALGVGSGSAQALARRHPVVVVELFTAQGCVSCNKATAPLADLADREGVIAMTLPVDYWDYLGWPDTLAMPEFTDRQKAYERHFDLRDVYTPQVVVDGAAQAPGDDGPAVRDLVAKAKYDLAKGPDILFRRDDRVAVGSGLRPKGGAEVWLLRYDPRSRDVEVKAGDNRGALVTERNVVRQIIRLGPWTGSPALFKIPPTDAESLSSVILVQGVHGGRIIAARERPALRE